MSDTPRTEALTIDADARWAALQKLAWNIGKLPIEELSEVEKAFCGAFWRAKAAKTRNAELERELSAAKAECEALRRDVITLCLRLCLEPTDSHSPDTLDVLDRYRSEWGSAAMLERKPTVREEG